MTKYTIFPEEIDTGSSELLFECTFKWARVSDTAVSNFAAPETISGERVSKHG
jgi:hypothetical protein